MKIASELDARGLLCPLPVLKARKAMKSVPGGAVLKLLTDDPAAVIDVPHFCAEAGHRCLSVEESDGGHVFYLERRAD